jgi:hypothetical protein
VKVIEFIPDEFKKWSKLVTSKALSSKWGEALFKPTYKNLEITNEEYFQGYKGSDAIAILSKEVIHMFELNSKTWCYIESAVKNDWELMELSIQLTTGMPSRHGVSQDNL